MPVRDTGIYLFLSFIRKNMSQAKLIKKIKMIPPAYQREVESFLDFILEKKVYSGSGRSAARKLGLLKGKMQMSPDFDEPSTAIW